ncbi:hypothetical protein I4U23_019757 [Adineta vaga]|nr:hypothetical protein I4U23_019757 [Adineta vaga]
MSSTLSYEDLIASIKDATIHLNRYLSIIIFLSGIIGNILNIFVLSKRVFFSNSCAFLFLISSITSLFAIVSGLTSRIVANWTVDLVSTVDWLCQFRGFILFSSRTVVLWLIMLATADRWLLSCADISRQQLRTLKNAQRGTISVIIFSILFNIPITFCYKSKYDQCSNSSYGKSLSCRLYTDLFYACGAILIPSLLMGCFSILIIYNVRHSLDYLKNGTNTTMINIRMRYTKKVDRQLILMSLIQVFVVLILVFPQAILKLYETFLTLNATNETRSALTKAIDDFIFNFVILLTYLANGLPFYIYLFSGGSLFRKICWQLVKSLVWKMKF